LTEFVVIFGIAVVIPLAWEQVPDKDRKRNSAIVKHKNWESEAIGAARSGFREPIHRLSMLKLRTETTEKILADHSLFFPLFFFYFNLMKF